MKILFFQWHINVDLVRFTSYSSNACFLCVRIYDSFDKNHKYITLHIQQWSEAKTLIVLYHEMCQMKLKLSVVQGQTSSILNLYTLHF